MKQIVMLIDSGSLHVATVGEILCQKPGDTRDVAVSRAEFVRMVQPYLPRGWYQVVFGRPAHYLYAALSGRWWAGSPSDSDGDLARHCRALIEAGRWRGESWVFAHAVVRACGPRMFPSLCNVALDGGGNQVGDGAECYESVPLGS